MAEDQAVNIDYDESGDGLYVSLGPPREAYSVEPEEGILLRVDPDSGELVGLTIIDFQLRLDRMPERLTAIPLIPADLLPTVLRKWRQSYARPKPAAVA